MLYYKAPGNELSLRRTDFSPRDNHYILWSVASMKLYIVFLPFSQNEMFILEDRDNVHF